MGEEECRGLVDVEGLHVARVAAEARLVASVALLHADGAVFEPLPQKSVQHWQQSTYSARWAVAPGATSSDVGPRGSAATIGHFNAFVFVIILTGCMFSGSRPRDRADGALPMEFARGIDRAPRAQPARRRSAKQAYIEAAAMV